MNQRVVVTGLGCLSGLAQGVEATWRRLCDGDDAARPFKRVSRVPNAAVEGVAIWIDAVDTAAFGRRFNARLLEQMDLSSVYALVAAHEALEGSGLLDQPDVLRKAGVFIGCGGGGLTSVEQSYERLFVGGARALHPMSIPRQMPSAPASHVSIIFETEGPCFGVTSACASSAHAIAEATAMIRHGRLDLAIVGGTEAPMTIGSWMAWQALRTLANERCRPFSAGRDGMMLGEGAAILVLESEAHAHARGADPLAEILGSGASSDAHHMTHPNGAGAVKAIRAALTDSGLTNDAPMLISSHGTGTIVNDSSEATALRQVFGDALDHSTVLATKSAHGHLCGAGGAIELLIGLLALRHRLAPPVLNYLGADPDCAVPLPLGMAKPIDHTTLLSNSFAFGGLNSVLVARAC
jgi:nodulation protein E